jgi:hypothetical protein
MREVPRVAGGVEEVRGLPNGGVAKALRVTGRVHDQFHPRAASAAPVPVLRSPTCVPAPIRRDSTRT